MTDQKLAIHGRPHSINGSDPIPPGDWHKIGDPGEVDFINGYSGDVYLQLDNEGHLNIEGVPTGGTAGEPFVVLPEWARPPRDVGNDLIVLVKSTGEVTIIDVIDGGPIT